MTGQGTSARIGSGPGGGPRQTRPARRVQVLALIAVLATAASAGILLWRPGQPAQPESPAVRHIHGLGVNAADDNLYVAAHDGLYRLPQNGPAARVADRVQDFMGLEVVGRDQFLASGHPGPDGDGPSSVGLIESPDAGLTWTNRSLAGQADFHALAATGGTVYGYDANTETVMASSDGQAWTSTALPGVADLAADPADAMQVLATTSGGVARSRDGGRSFAAPAGPVLMLLSWTQDDTVVGVTPAGRVQTSRDAGATWQPRGDVRGIPTALTADGSAVHVAVDGRVLSSTDHGDTFTMRWQA